MGQAILGIRLVHYTLLQHGWTTWSCLLTTCHSLTTYLWHAQAKGFARNSGFHLAGEEETASADELRGAVSDALCRNIERRENFRDVLPGVREEGGLAKYAPHTPQNSAYMSLVQADKSDVCICTACMTCFSRAIIGTA